MSKDPELIDAVYIVGGVPAWKDNELLFSLRSLERHMKFLRRVFVIGRKPSFLNDQVIHIPHHDIYTNKARNIMSKVYRAATDNRVSKDFILLNDDYFFTHDFNPITYPYYYKCDLAHTIKINGNEYGKHIKSTFDALQGRGFALKNFDTHKPIKYNKALLKEVVDSYTWDKPYGYTLKSLYCNTLKIEGQFKEDLKISHTAIISQWYKLIQKSDDMFSIGDPAVNISLKNFLAEYYPDKSKFEI